MNLGHVSDEALDKVLALRGLGDFVDEFVSGVAPATSMPKPPGPADFPIATAPVAGPATAEQWLARIFDVMSRLLDETIKQSIPSRPQIRSAAATDAGATLSWTVDGVMDRLMIRNKGTDSVWFAFDQNGASVTAATSPLSFELQANESVNLALCRFNKIGLKCATGKTATVHAIAFQSIAGNQGAGIA